MKTPNEAGYHSVYGLSCIENHILALAKNKSFPIHLLYYSSFVSLDGLANAFFKQALDYSHFDGVERIQEELKRLQVLSMVLYKDSIQTCMTHIQNNDAAVLLLLKEDYAKETFQIRAWHEKHYVLLVREDEKFYLLNDIPFARRMVDLEQSDAFYGGEYFIARFDEEQFAQAIAYLQTIRPVVRRGETPCINIHTKQVVQFRDLIGVYRVLLRRQQAFCEGRMETTFFDPFIKEVDSIYMQIEYLKLKHNIHGEALQDMWTSLRDIEREIQNDVIKGGVCIAAE